MEKTIEEKEIALVAYLQRQCDNATDQADIGNGVTIYRMQKNTPLECFQFSTYGMNTYHHVVNGAAPLRNKAEMIAFHYRVAGLELQDECERSARLVKALEKIKEGSFVDIWSIKICDKAIAAHKKGVTNEPN